MYNTKLYRQLRLGSIIFSILSFVFFLFSLFCYSSSDDKTDHIVNLYNQAEKLYTELNHQKNLNSNLAVFAYNLIAATSNIVYSVQYASTLTNGNFLVSSTNSSSKVKQKNPFLKFTRYQEVNNLPLVMLDSKFFSVGDVVDGEIIKEIQPTYIKLGDQYYEIFKK